MKATKRLRRERAEASGERFRVHDADWTVQEVAMSLVDLGPEMRRLEATGLRHGVDYLPFKRQPRCWWLLRKA